MVRGRKEGILTRALTGGFHFEQDVPLQGDPAHAHATLSLPFLLPVVLLSVSCQQGDGGPVMKAGPTVTVFGGYGEVDYRRGPVSSDLQWLVTAPSYNMGSDGTPRSIDDRVTLAVQSPSMATWLLSTRITGRAALTLSNSLLAGLQAWSDVPCLPIDRVPAGRLM